jgi:hypothetical protein
VGEYAVSATGSGAPDAGELGAVPAVASLQMVDASFGSGSPFDLVTLTSMIYLCLGGLQVKLPTTT